MQNTNLPDLVVSLIHPTVVSMADQKYAVFEGKWYKVDSKFTIEDAFKRWKRWESGKVEAPSNLTQDQSWKVANSKGNGFYVVKYNKTSWSCNCAGFGFRRQCRHIDEIKKKVN